MNKNIRIPVAFGTMMGIFFVLQILLTENNLTTTDILVAVLEGIVVALVGGFLFNFFMRIFSSKSTKEKK